MGFYDPNNLPDGLAQSRCSRTLTKAGRRAKTIGADDLVVRASGKGRYKRGFYLLTAEGVTSFVAPLSALVVAALDHRCRAIANVAPGVHPSIPAALCALGY